MSQWGEVSSKSKKTRSKPKDTVNAAATTDSHSGSTRPSRGGRNVSESGRGGRGRGADRGGRAPRSRPAQPATNGARKEHNLSVPTEESTAWDTTTTTKQGDSESRGHAAAEQPASGPEPTKAAAPPAKTWASMLRQATAPKVAPKPKEPPVQKPTESLEPLPPVESPAPIEAPAAAEPEPEPEPVEAPATEEAPSPSTEATEPATELPPTKDALTESNLEQVNDTSAPAPTDTAASTAADSWAPAPADISSVPTPTSHAPSQTQPPPAVPQPAGFVATPTKPVGRAPHFQRRILDQEEAVRMPGNREVDRAAVQFGAFSLNGTEEDIDGDREEPETRAQPPDDSPIAHPRTSLPPVSQPNAVPESLSQKPAAPAVPAGAPTGIAPDLDGSVQEQQANAPSLAPAAQAQAQQPIAGQGMFSSFVGTNDLYTNGLPYSAQPVAQTAQSFGRFGAQEGAPGFASLNQQGAATISHQQQQYENFQAQQQPAQPPHTSGAFSSAPGDFSSYYTADQQNRAPYNYYGQQYGQQQHQASQGQPEPTAATQQPQPQRAFGGYNQPSQADNLSQYPQSGVGGLHNQSRFGGVATDPQSSGHTTPNPPGQGQGQQQPTGQTSQPQSHAQQNYPYNTHPYFNNPYYHTYYAQAYGQGGYGGAPYGKGGIYGAPYNIPPQAPYDHSSSPAGGFQSSLHRDNNGIGSGLGDYGRVGSAQSGHQGGLGASSFGGMHDTFGRGPSSYQSQAGQGFNAQSQGAGSGSANDDLKPYVDSKTAAGPSPSLGGARPGSATNNAPAGQGGLPPQSNAQMAGYGGYPSHLQQGLHGSSGYGMGGGSGAGQHGNTPYGSYGQGGFGSGGYYGGGGQQQQQQQQQQQRGGWGGNYNH